jgi:hypothetical protein
MANEQENQKFVSVFSSFSQSDIISAKMALENEGIEYSTQNENFAAVYPTPGIGTVDFLVEQRDAERARLAFASLIRGTEE